MSKNKNNLLFYIVAIALFIPLIASAYTLEMPLPGTPASFSDPGQYIQYLFKFGFYLIAFLAVAMITYGGVLYMIPSKMAEAKERIWGAVIGVVFLLCSFLILRTIDPNLLNLTLGTPTAVKTLKAPTLPEIISGAEDPASPEDSGSTDSQTTPTGENEIKCKTVSICQDIQGGRISSTLVGDLGSLPSIVTITETTGSHGCSSGDTCVDGAACGSSSHCSGRAADIRVSNLSNSEKEAVMKTLSGNKCVDQLFYSGFPQYCRASGGQPASGSKSCANHSDHIHYSVKAGCS